MCKKEKCQNCTNDTIEKVIHRYYLTSAKALVVSGKGELSGWFILQLRDDRSFKLPCSSSVFTLRYTFLLICLT